MDLTGKDERKLRGRERKGEYNCITNKMDVVVGNTLYVYIN